MTAMQQKIEAIDGGHGIDSYCYRLGDTVNVYNGDLRKVEKILQKLPVFPGDSFYHQVCFDDGSSIQIYSPSRVFLGQPQPAPVIMQPGQKLIT